MNVWINTCALGHLWSTPVLECKPVCMVMMATGVGVWNNRRLPRVRDLV